MAYVLVNPDNTVNFIGDRLENWLILEGVVIHEIADKTTAELMGNIPPEHCVWDKNTESVLDDREHPEVVKPVNRFFDTKEEELEAVTIAVRDRRDHLLRVSDARLSAKDRPDLDVEAWKAYRQKLRDVPQQNGFPEHVSWPDPPSKL